MRAIPGSSWKPRSSSRTIGAVDINLDGVADLCPRHHRGLRPRPADPAAAPARRPRGAVGPGDGRVEVKGRRPGPDRRLRDADRRLYDGQRLALLPPVRTATAARSCCRRTTSSMWSPAAMPASSRIMPRSPAATSDQRPLHLLTIRSAVRAARPVVPRFYVKLTATPAGYDLRTWGKRSLEAVMRGRILGARSGIARRGLAGASPRAQAQPPSRYSTNGRPPEPRPARARRPRPRARPRLSRRGRHRGPQHRRPRRPDRQLERQPFLPAAERQQILGGDHRLAARRCRRARPRPRVTITRADLTLFNQPIAAQIGPNGYTTTLGSLMFRALTQSDNTCNDIVLRHAGGPSRRPRDARAQPARRDPLRPGRAAAPGRDRRHAMEQRLLCRRAASRRPATRFPATGAAQAFERYIDDPVDGVTPEGITNGLARLQRGELLSRASTSRLLSILSQARTGPQRLRGGLAPGWYDRPQDRSGPDPERRPGRL